jgi:hypothetical protein
MTKYLLAAAALAAIGFAGAAYAGDATTPKAVSDSELDRVTAGNTIITVLRTDRQIIISKTILPRTTPGVVITSRCTHAPCP